ncbi:hypothetical protein B0H10DRAFT_2432140 [Mycena sp. CBHHK59/15]|nr:hypothetical protein B0H10DRAFT_2432140 [Mycena sp. CBHHK59/15]
MAEMQTYRKKLQEDPYYLGNQGATNNVAWRKVGKEDMLVSAEAAAAHDAVERAAATDANEDDTDANTDADRGNLEPVGLTLVGTIAARDCWLMPCGFWKGSTVFTPTFADLKLNCRIVAPTDPPFASDFQVALKNIETLATKAETKGHDKVGVFDAKDKSKSSIKLRHVVFEEKEAGDVDDPHAFQLRDWPVKSAAAQESLDGMDDTHRVIPITAYDLDGDLIPPSAYVSALMGAVVRATFTMSHWNIARDKRDTYAADIESLRVVIPPPKIASGSSGSPRKRKATIAARDLGASPEKKSRV